MIEPLLALALATAPPPADSVYGIVRVTGTGEPVSDVEVRVTGERWAVLSDATGRYVLRDLAAGRVALLFRRLGFESITVSVLLSEEGAARIDVDLTVVPLPLASVAVETTDSFSPGSGTADTQEIGLSHLTPAAARRDPFVAGRDLFTALAATPIVGGRLELSPSLRVRGGSGDENLLLVDGIPWRGPRPLGGIAGWIPSGAVAALDFHSAVPPPRYGDALSSMIVVRPRTADPAHLAAESVLDPTTAEQTVSGPLPIRGATLLVSGRRTYRSIFAEAEERGGGANGFSDIFGRISMSGVRDVVDLYLLGGRQRLAFPSSVSSATSGGGGTSQLPDSSPLAPARNRFIWSGALAGAVWTRAFGDGRRAQTRLWYSDVSGEVAWGVIGVTSGLHDLGLRFNYTTEQSEVGFAVSRSATRYRVSDTVRSSVLSGAPLVVAAFASRTWAPAPRWTLVTGVRISRTAPWGLAVEPRVWTRVGLGEKLSASLGYARLHQYVQSARNEESVLEAVGGGDLATAAGTAGRPPGRSDQVTAAFDMRLGSRTTARLQGYQRWMSGLALAGAASPLPFADGFMAVGRASVLGGDAALSYEGDRLDIRAQVQVLQAVRTTDSVRYRSADAQERLQLGASYRFAAATTVQVGLWVGREGRTTPIQNGLEFEPFQALGGAGELAGSPQTGPGPLNAVELPTYARADVSLTRGWGERISTTLTVSNIMNRRNVLTYAATPDGVYPVPFAPRALTLRARWYLGR